MADRLAEPANRAAYTRRSTIIEPVFAQLFNHFGRDLLTRGDAADTQLHLWATSHNLAKLLRHRTPNHQQTTGRQPADPEPATTKPSTHRAEGPPPSPPHHTITQQHQSTTNSG